MKGERLIRLYNEVQALKVAYNDLSVKPTLTDTDIEDLDILKFTLDSRVYRGQRILSTH